MVIEDVLVECYDSQSNFAIDIDYPPWMPEEGTSVPIRIKL